MGAQSSGLIAEIFLQHKEHSHLTRLTHKHKILNYCRYVDDILLIFNSSHTEIQKILDDFSSLHHKLQFTAKTEKGHNLNYLDISTNRTTTNMRTAIYRKPTFTDTIIPFTSNHPTHHKYTAVRHLHNRQHLQPTTQRISTWTKHHNILHNNSFPINPHKPPTHNTRKQVAPSPTQKWASFTYVGKETLYIPNIFRQNLR